MRLTAASSISRVRALPAMLCLVLPWLNPFAPGPAASVQPWVLAALCASALPLLWARASIPLRVAAPFAALVAWAMLRSGINLDTLALAGGAAVICIGCAGGRGALAEDAAGAGMIARAWVAAALASTVIALMQALGTAQVLGTLANVSPQAEAFGNLRQRNLFASLTAIGFAALCWLVARGGLRVSHVAAAVLLAFGNAATTSRTGLVEMLVLIALTLAWRSPSRRDLARLCAAWILAWGVGALTMPLLQAAAGVASSGNILERVSGVEACSSRSALWANVLQLIVERPWTGWGWGELDYAHFATLYPGARFCDILDNAHNLPLHLAAELGVPAALIASIVVAAAVLRGRAQAAGADGRLGWSVLVILGVHSMLEYPLWYGPFQLALGLAIALIIGGGSSPAVPRRLGAAQLLAVVLALCVAYVSWDYRRVSQVYLEPHERLAAYRDDTLEHARASRIFANQARFAELTLSTLTRATAQWSLDESLHLLHYSPEPRIIERAIESATMLGHDDLALWLLVRFRAAFPQAHAQWSLRLRMP